MFVAESFRKVGHVCNWIFSARLSQGELNDEDREEDIEALINR